jgi:hypothetical protein
VWYVLGSRDEGERVAKPLWQMKLVAELQPDVTRESRNRVDRTRRQAGPAEFGLWLAKAKQTNSSAAGSDRAGTGHSLERMASLMCTPWPRIDRQRSLSGAVSIAVRRRAGARPTAAHLPCQAGAEVKDFAVTNLGGMRSRPSWPNGPICGAGAVRQDRALLSELLPMNGARSAGTVRNRTMRLGENRAAVVRKTAKPSRGTGVRSRRF